MASPKRLIVTGATGKQGGALISALLASPSSHQPFEIYAVTRNKTSRSAQSLASKPNVRILEGDFKDPAAIFSQVNDPWGLFAVTMPSNAKVEEEQGKALTKAAMDAGVKHIVFTSVERGVDSENDPTPVPHFRSKFKIEKDIVEKCTEKGEFTYTILRPVAFMENLSNDFLGKGFVSMWRLNGLDRKLQLVSTSDVGKLAAESFLRADRPEYRNKSISIAGDEISPAQAEVMFKEVTGQEIPSTYPFVARMLKWFLHEQLGIMFDWFRTTGFGVDVAGMKTRYPFLRDFRAWLEEESAWKKM